MVGEYEKAVETDDVPAPVGVLALDLMGQCREAASRLRAQMTSGLPQLFRLFLDGMIGSD